MSELTYLVLKFGFLAIMWVFIAGIVYALRSDLFGQRVRRVVARAREAQVTARAAAPAPAPFTERARRDDGPALDEPDLTMAPDPRRLVVTEGPKQGLEIDLPDEELTIGRSADAGLVIRDDFTSSHHARLLHWPTGWVIQDLDSTNGTFLDGVRVHAPTPVPPRTPVTIGTTTFELRS